MSELKIDSSAIGDNTSTFQDFSVDPQTLDSAQDQKDTEYINQRWGQQLGYYKSIPELKAAIDTKARWIVGKGFKSHEITEIALSAIKGFGKDVFNSILENQVRVKEIGGDSFAEIIRDEEGNLINLKPISPGSIKTIANRAGIISRYEQIDRPSKSFPRRIWGQIIGKKANLRLTIVAVLIVFIGAGSAWATEVIAYGTKNFTFFSLNLENGTRTTIPCSVSHLQLAFAPDGTLYATSRNTDNLYKFTEPSTGELEYIATLPVNCVGGDTTVSPDGKGVYFTLGWQSRELFRYDIEDAVIDSLGIIIGADDHIYGLAFSDDGILYGTTGTSGGEKRLYTIDLITLQATAVGPALFGIQMHHNGTSGSLDFAPDGTLYAGIQPVDAALPGTELYLSTINPQTGIGNIDYNKQISGGLDSIAIVSEPVILERLKIIGPNEVAENFQAQYTAIAVYDNNSTKDVTDSALWSVDPNINCSISAGLLTTQAIDLPEDVTVYAEYTEGEPTKDANKPVTIIPICPDGFALDFDGVDDYMRTSYEDGPSEYTITLWYNLNEDINT